MQRYKINRRKRRKRREKNVSLVKKTKKEGEKEKKPTENLRDTRKSSNFAPLFGVTAVVWAEVLPGHVALERQTIFNFIQKNGFD